MFIIYDLIFLVIAIIYLPIYLFKNKFHRGFLLRLGFLPPDLELNRPIWIHAVSVGEAAAVKGLLEELRIIYPDKKLLISTVTPTGNRIAKAIAKDNDFVTYLPLDCSFIIRGVIDRINPAIFIIAETELWPNLITYLYKKKIPTVVVNGRISDSSFRGYLTIKFLVKPILNKISLLCVQTNRDAQRLISLGVFKNKIEVSGNMKFDIADLKKGYTDYRLRLGLEPQEKLFVAGSTHPGEEKIILDVYKKLQLWYPYLRLLIAPRHPERAVQIESLITRRKFKPVRISQLDLSSNIYNLRPIFILDTVGELLSFYDIAEIVFVGGSLVRKGGHNILEPASLAKAILFGPYMSNFRNIADLFLKTKAAIPVHNQEELENRIIYLLDNPFRISQLGQSAKEIILQNQGATKRNAELIRTTLSAS